MANLQDFRVKRGLIVSTTSALTGNVAVSSNLAVSGQTVLTGNTTINGVVSVANQAAFTSGNVTFNTSTLVVDSTNSRVSVNAASSTVAFYVQGAANVSTTLTTANLVATNIQTTTAAVNTLTVTGATNSSIGTSTLFINPTALRVGVNTATPDATLAVSGTANVTGTVWIGNTSSHVGSSTFGNTVTITGAATLNNTLSVASDVTILNGNVALSNTSKYFVGSVTGSSNTTLRSVVAGSYLTGGGQLTGDVTLNVYATPSNVGNYVVARNASGDFSAGTIGASVVNATTFNGSLYGTAYQANTLWDTSSSAWRQASQGAYGSTIVCRDTGGNIQANFYYGTAQYANYGDVAEMYLADDVYEPGTVMVVGGDKEVTACTWGQRPIGAVSTNPAYLMNYELEGGTPVALKGRIPMKVSGPVKKGDRLVAGVQGTATATDVPSPDVFAMALETDSNFGIRLVECIVL